MSWSVNFLLLFLFVYTTTGIPINDNPKRKLSLSSSLMPSQWGKDSEISYHWPKGEVPYVFDDKSYDNGVKARVRIAMAALERDSCIRFKEQKGGGDGSWLHFTNPGMQRQCFHDPSYQANGEIQVVLGYDCLRQRDIMHSVLHGVGFRDEVSHPQRDLFVKIMWGNIQPAYKSMFRIQPVDKAGGLVEYDPMSIMHFHDRAYSLNGQATITPLLPGLRIAPSDKLSHLDKMKLRIMFGHECNKRKVGEVLNKCKGILAQYDKAELTPAKQEDGNSANNEDAKDDSRGNPRADPNASSGNNDGNQEGYGDGLQETIVVDNDASVNNDGGQNENKDGLQETIVVGNDASVNNDGGQNENKDGLQETIEVANDVASVITNDKDDVGDNQYDNSKNVDLVEVNEDDDTTKNQNVVDNQEVIVVGQGPDNLDERPVNSDDTANLNNNNKDAKQPSEVIIVGNDYKGGDISYDNNKDPEENNEAIIVGNDNKEKNPDPEDLK